MVCLSPLFLLAAGWNIDSGWNTDAVIGARMTNSGQEVKTKYVEDG